MSFDRQTPEYRKWRNDVLFRDGYKCAVCGSKDNLEAHHIKPVAQFPELALDINNGTTLCLKCHYDAHGKRYSDSIVNSTPSLIGNLHPIFIKLREWTYYLSYRTNIVRRFWKELPLPHKFKRWLEELFIAFIVLLIFMIGSVLR